MTTTSRIIASSLRRRAAASPAVVVIALAMLLLSSSPPPPRCCWAWQQQHRRAPLCRPAGFSATRAAPGIDQQQRRQRQRHRQLPVLSLSSSETTAESASTTAEDPAAAISDDSSSRASEGEGEEEDDEEEEYEYVEVDFLTEEDLVGSEWLVGTNWENRKLDDVQETWVRLVVDEDGQNVAVWGDSGKNGKWNLDQASQFLSFSKESLLGGKKIWACTVDDYYYLQGTVRGWNYLQPASVLGQWQAKRLGVDPDEAGTPPWFRTDADEEDEIQQPQSEDDDST